MEEIWKDIENYEGFYQISNLGNIRSLDRIRKSKHGTAKIKGVNLKQSITNAGYKQVVLRKFNIPQNASVHRFVIIAFLGVNKFKREVNHINGIKTDNRIENLEWVTRSENGFHAFKNNLHIPHDCKGIKNGRAKLSEIQVLEIISLLYRKTNTEIASLYNVKTGTISAIRNKRLWKHLQN